MLQNLLWFKNIYAYSCMVFLRILRIGNHSLEKIRYNWREGSENELYVPESFLVAIKETFCVLVVLTLQFKGQQSVCIF